MILEPINYDIAGLLDSDATVGVCQVESDLLLNLILEVRERGFRLVIVESVSGEHFLIFAAARAHQGNVVGDVRQWSRKIGIRFFVKMADERWPMPAGNTIILPDGRTLEIRFVMTRAQNNTQWLLHNQEVLPAGYVRI